MTNPQIFCEGALSVTLAAVGGGELTAAKNIMKISKATTNSQLFKTTVTATYCLNFHRLQPKMRVSTGFSPWGQTNWRKSQDDSFLESTATAPTVSLLTMS